MDESSRRGFSHIFSQRRHSGLVPAMWALQPVMWPIITTSLLFFQCPEIRNQLVEQFKCLEQQSESRIQLLQDLQEFFRRKAEIELEYSRSLDKLAERFSSKIRSSREHQLFKWVAPRPASSVRCESWYTERFCAKQVWTAARAFVSLIWMIFLFESALQAWGQKQQGKFPSLRKSQYAVAWKATQDELQRLSPAFYCGGKTQ